VHVENLKQIAPPDFKPSGPNPTASRLPRTAATPSSHPP
jgi:hypothetical protein